jgi:hypothetical protein
MGSGESQSAVRTRSRLRLFGVVLLALCLGAGLAAGDAAAKKKKSKSATVFAGFVSPNLAIPNVPTGPAPIASSTITVGKKFKGKVVGDVNVTGIKTTGDSANAAGDLAMEVVAPNGKAVLLFSSSLGGQSIGPLTLDDDTATSVCDSVTLNCRDPDQTLIRPFAGTANLNFLFNGDSGPLVAFNGVPMRGTWTALMWDFSSGGTSVLNSWGLQITAARPVR